MKKFINTHFLLLIVLSLVMSGCKEDDNVSQPENQVVLNFNLTLPVGSLSPLVDPEAPQTRVGDPGVTEYFERPRFLYVFFTSGDPTTPASNPVYKYALRTDQSRWTRTADSLYYTLSGYSEEVQLEEGFDFKRVRAYIAASFDELTFVDANKLDFVSNAYQRISLSEAELLDLKFYAYNGTSGSSRYDISLRDVYSTPYNLQMNSENYGKMPAPHENRTDYYGTVKSNRISSVSITFDDTLYHTAAKVDFQWNASDYSQSKVMQAAKVTNCPRQGYLFRQVDQVGAGTYSKLLLSGGNMTADDMNASHEAKYADVWSVNPGNQWSGRAYTWVLQPGNLNYTVSTVDASRVKENNGTVRVDDNSSNNGKGDNGISNDIFAAWYKLNFTIE